MKKSTIGFKACMDENAKTNSDPENNASAEEDTIAEKINAQYEFEKHMEEYNTIKSKLTVYKNIILFVLAALILFLALKQAYDYGAYMQIIGNGPYRSVTTSNNETIIVRK